MLESLLKFCRPLSSISWNDAFLIASARETCTCGVTERGAARGAPLVAHATIKERENWRRVVILRGTRFRMEPSGLLAQNNTTASTLVSHQQTKVTRSTSRLYGMQTNPQRYIMRSILHSSARKLCPIRDSSRVFHAWK